MLIVILFIIIVLLFLFPIKIYSRLKTGTIINVTSTSVLTSKVLFAIYGDNICTKYVSDAWNNTLVSVSQLVVDNNYNADGFLTIIVLHI